MQPIVHDFRPRAAQWLAATGALATLPFALVDFAHGRMALGLALLGLSAGLATGVWLLIRGHATPTHVVCIFGLPAIVLNTVAIGYYDLYVAFWAFTVVLALYLVLPLRWALVTSGIMVVLSTTVTFARHGTAVGSRYAVCLTLIAVFGAVTVHLVDDRQRRLIEQVVTDPLTGLLNRMTLMPALAAAASPPAPSPTSLLTIDIDHFKTINDRFGHEAGDKVLAGFAVLARTHLRAGAPVFRLGGEEFLVVVEGSTRADAEVIGHRLRRSVQSHAFLDGHTVTVSIGVAERVPGESVGDWLRRADEALYRAKDAGRNALVVA